MYHISCLCMISVNTNRSYFMQKQLPSKHTRLWQYLRWLVRMFNFNIVKKGCYNLVTRFHIYSKHLYNLVTTFSQIHPISTCMPESLISTLWKSLLQPCHKIPYLFQTFVQSCHNICANTPDLHMHARKFNFNIVKKLVTTLSQDSIFIPNICTILSQYLCKYTRFPHACQKS